MTDIEKALTVRELRIGIAKKASPWGEAVTEGD